MKNIGLFFGLIFLMVSCSQRAMQSSSVQLSNHSHTLINGPMVGYSTMKEVAVWIQGNAGQYQLQYKDGEGNQYKSAVVYIPEGRENTAILLADKVQPGQLYSYQVVANNAVVGTGHFQSQPLWQWRNNPPNFSFVLGSCAYINEQVVDRPGEPYGGNYEIFESIYKKSPNFMVWGGDNMYLREADWNSMTGIWHRYTHSRQVPEMKELLANVHNYAVWDDHDFGPNDSDRSYYLKDSTYKAFTKFWANPSYGINGKPGITTKFQWNDCEFFVLDNRYYRTPNNKKIGDRFILGQEQIDWLIDNLINSKASFKFIVIGNQVVTSVAKFENHATYEQEREELLSLIQKENIENVIFLSGDRHHSEISVMQEAGNPTIIDVTSSPLTSKSHTPRDEGNVYQVENSLIHERNFALFNVSGKLGERQLHIQYFDVNGEPIFTYEIHQENKKKNQGH